MYGKRKRIEALERSTTFRRRPNALDEISRRAMEQLSDEELRAMRDWGRDQRQGIDRGLTERECEAVRAYNSAVELECQRAGFRSRAQVEALYPGVIR